MRASYPTYKSTSIPWLPEMPEHWDLLPIRAVFVERGERNDGLKTDYILSVLKDRGVVPYSEKGNVGNKMSERIDNYKVVHPEDLVINKMNAIIGSLGMSKYYGALSQVYFVLKRKRPNDEPRFLAYLFQNKEFQPFLSTISSGIMELRESIDKTKFNSLKIPIPPPLEQTAIADYLDFRLEQINRFIEKKEKLIALLKKQKAVILNEFVTEGLNSSTLKKQTNLIWLEEVPSHWTLCKLKHIAKVQSGLALNEGLKVINGVTFPYLRVANVQDGYIDLTEVKTVQVNPQTAKRVRLQKYDLLMNEGGDFDKLGRGVVWEEQIKHCLHQNHVFAVRVKKDIDPYWINILTQTFYGRSYFISKAKRTTNLASISSSNIKEFPVLLPPKEEIENIKNRLENEFSKIDITIARIETEIKKVKELKQSLIAEVVTGRIKVVA